MFEGLGRKTSPVDMKYYISKEATGTRTKPGPKMWIAKKGRFIPQYISYADVFPSWQAARNEAGKRNGVVLAVPGINAKQYNYRGIKYGFYNRNKSGSRQYIPGIKLIDYSDIFNSEREMKEAIDIYLDSQEE